MITSTSTTSMTASSSQVHYAQPGQCQNVKTGATRCAFSSDDCEPARNDDGERWFNALRLEERGIKDPCRCEDTLIGACVNVGGKHMTYECAPRTNNVEDYCRKEQQDENGNWLINTPTYEVLPTNSAGTNCYCDALQSIEDDIIRNSPASRTKYGACYIPNTNAGGNVGGNVGGNLVGEEGHFFCAYSSEYCTGDHVWVYPNEVPDIRGDGEYCTCESTHIGGCIGGFQPFHCGVSENDCRSNRFILPIPLKTKHNHACFLCEMTRTVDPKPDEIDMVEFASSKLSNAAAVSIGVAVSILALVLLGVVRTFVRNNKKKNQRQTVTEQHEKQSDDNNHVDIDIASEEATSNNGDDDSSTGIPENIPADEDRFEIS